MTQFREKKTQFNCNNYVTIYLNEYGEKVLEDYRKELSVITKMEYSSLYIPDEKKSVRMQLWKVMKIFGEHIHGVTAPFSMIIDLE